METNIRSKVSNDSPVMAWLVRWAAEIISKYAPGEDGRTAYERLRHERCMVPLVPFGERMLYLPLKIVRRDNGNTAKREGVWLGVIERIEKVIIGPKGGAIKCRTVTRLPESQRWMPTV